MANIIPKSFYAQELIPDPRLMAQAPDRAVLATTTMYKSVDGRMNSETELRAKLALRMFEKACGFGYDVVVVDGASDAGWRARARDAGVILLDEDLANYPGTKPMGRGRRQAIDAAYNVGKEVVVWTEPEKHPLIYNDSTGEKPVNMIVAPVLEGVADIVIPCRIDELASYPTQQRASELTGNLTVMDIMQEYAQKHGLPSDAVQYLDLWIGPRAMNAQGTTRFLEYKGELPSLTKPGTMESHDLWESIFVPVWQAMADGLKVRGVAVPYVHPAEQTALEGAKAGYSSKRIQQLNTLVEAATKFVGGLEKVL